MDRLVHPESLFLKMCLWLCFALICWSAWGFGIPHGNPLSSFPQVLLLSFPFLERSWLADRVFFLERRVESPLMEK